ncbi:MAG: zinc ribbon domain-containing protein [Dehalococcoidia bacterium]|nr:zinc ribbon domain-containing protein [Dehalococcoidia bacterium]
MPIYEYRCEDCQEKTAKLVRGFDAPDSISCPPHHLQRGVPQVAQHTVERA